MHKKQSHTAFFILALLASFVLLFAGISGYTGFIERVGGFLTSPFGVLQTQRVSEGRLQEENRMLRLELVKLQHLEQENKALRDQFETQTPKSTQLLPATIIGKPTFIPGMTLPEEFVIDKGTDHGVAQDQGVTYKDNLVGKIGRVAASRSVVVLLTKEGFTIPVKNSRTGALGLVKGKGKGEIVLDNVVLSEELRLGDMLVTSGSMNEHGVGIPPELVVGKIISIDKRPSALFQMARVQSLLDMTTMTTIFITKQQ